MASIVKRGPYQWQVKIRRKGWPKQTKTFETHEEAMRWARKIESEMDDGIFVCRKEAENTTLEEALERYRREVTQNKKGAVQEGYRIDLFLRSPLRDRFLATIKSSDVAKFRDDRLESGVSPYTVNNDLILLSNLFTVARREWGMESLTNPVSHVRRPQLPEGRDRRLYPGEEEQLLAALPNSIKPIFVLALETAMRRGEILDLRWDNIDLARRVIHLSSATTKTSSSRDVPLSSRAIAAFKKLPKRLDGAVFEITKHHVTKTFRETCEKLNIEDLRFHDLRHEATSRLFEKGFNPMEVSSVTGHKTLQMLKRYTHLKAEDLAARLG